MTLTILEPRRAALELDGLTVGRLLPSARRRMVGPWIFFDAMGPAELLPGKPMDVRPHPHIGLSTVTYLFEGIIDHRDSLGAYQPIRPGEINWMTAGRGIAHSERTPNELRDRVSRLHGIQLWCALPNEEEEREPAFDHYDAEVMPELNIDGTRVRLLAGSGWDAQSPVIAYSPLIYAELHVAAGATVPLPSEHPELAVYVVDGTLSHVDKERMLIFDRDDAPRIIATTNAHVMLLGGAPVGKRHIWWNFVSSSKERIEQAKRDWQEGRFAKVVGDEVEFVPLP